MKKYGKPYRIRKRKSILKNRFFWFGFLALVIIEGIIHLIFFSGIFQIKNIMLQGTEIISQENIKALIPQKSIFSADVGEIEESILNSFPQIGRAEIRKSFPGTLEVLLAERVPSALWCSEAGCFAVDSEGVIFGEAVQQENDLIKITGDEAMLNKEKFSQILKIKEKMSGDLGITAVQSAIISEERLNVKTSEGWEAYFNLKGNLDWQVQELGLVLEKQISPAKRRNLEYVDLRFSRVFYK